MNEFKTISINSTESLTQIISVLLMSLIKFLKLYETCENNYIFA